MFSRAIISSIVKNLYSSISETWTIIFPETISLKKMYSNFFACFQLNWLYFSL